jgi:adenine-specific DNA-methyltransferase
MAPRKSTKKPAGPTPVEAIVHPDKRANLPLADAHDFVSPEVEKIPKWRTERDPSLDPQLVWKGKDEQDLHDLEVDAPPIYIQEKIDPRVLIENLRETAKASELEPEMTLFETFDGLGELDLVDYYRHEANWSNRMILGDSLQVMASLAEREALRGKVQMIYIDPPYGIKFGSNWQVSARKRDVKDGKLEDASREVEMIRAFRDTWELGIHSYLSYLRDRLEVARDVLSESGSIFVQIGDENVHLVRALMDEVFGSENFVGQITFRKASGAGSFAGGTTLLANVSDFIVWYAKERDRAKYRQLFSLKTAGEEGATKYNRVEEPDGRVRPATPNERSSGVRNGRLMVDQSLVSQTTRVGQTTVFPVDYEGRTYIPGTGGWKTNRVGMDKLKWAQRLLPADRTLRFRRFFEDFPAFPLVNVWNDIGGIQSRTDPKVYVVQTATRAIERCVLMSTDPGDLVVDPTCGSGTTAFVAEQWGRRWITVDSSRVALALARQRLMGAKFPYYLIADSAAGRKKEEELTGESLAAGEPTKDIRRGLVYDRVQHVTLKSIANNPDIIEGMSRGEIDAAIKRHAEYELLVDKPYEDKSKVRVTGPFTVESLSPHRSLAFAGQAPESEEPADAAASTESFETMILENLRKAGIQNGKRKERLEFDVLEPYAGGFIQAVGERSDAENGPRRVGIAVGPQYATVSPTFIKKAALEAIRAKDIGLLCVLAFAFDPQAVGAVGDDVVSSDEGFDVAAERSLGRVPVLLVRMNADLVMGTDLKKTGAGNLFTVFGEPDIVIKEEGDELVVELLGVDVYDPTTGEIRSNATDQIALWMIDTNYNGESFFVRHCYFTGGQDPYKRLKTALKAEIDEDAWASLYATTSRSFPRPETGKIAAKVINDYGDEVMKVFEV